MLPAPGRRRTSNGGCENQRTRSRPDLNHSKGGKNEKDSDPRRHPGGNACNGNVRASGHRDALQPSDGEIDVQIFGADSLVGAKENIVAVAKGDIECAYSVNFQWGKTLPIMNVTLAPFAFGDIEIWKKWPNSEAAAFLSEKLLEKGVRNVNWLFTTNTSTFTHNGSFLVKPEDYQGLATGVIDAGLTDVAAAVSRKYYEVQDHFTILPVISVYFHGYVNPAWYDGLSDKAKAALKTAGEQAAVWAIEASEEAGAAAPGELEAKGSKVHINSAEENAALEAIMRPAFDEKFIADSPDSKKLLELLGAK